MQLRGNGQNQSKYLCVQVGRIHLNFRCIYGVRRANHHEYQYDKTEKAMNGSTEKGHRRQHKLQSQ